MKVELAKRKLEILHKPETARQRRKSVRKKIRRT